MLLLYLCILYSESLVLVFLSASITSESPTNLRVCVCSVGCGCDQCLRHGCISSLHTQSLFNVPCCRHIDPHYCIPSSIIFVTPSHEWLHHRAVPQTSQADLMSFSLCIIRNYIHTISCKLSLFRKGCWTCDF